VLLLYIGVRIGILYRVEEIIDPVKADSFVLTRGYFNMKPSVPWLGFFGMLLRNSLGMSKTHCIGSLVENFINIEALFLVDHIPRITGADSESGAIRKTELGNVASGLWDF
jgi:hypothetical protein